MRTTLTELISGIFSMNKWYQCTSTAWNWWCTGWSKNGTFLYPLTSSDIDRFSNLFHCQDKENICNNSVTKDLATPPVCCYTTSRNVFKSNFESL